MIDPRLDSPVLIGGAIVLTAVTSLAAFKTGSLMRPRTIGTAVLLGVGGAGLTAVLSWILTDVADVFGFSPTLPMRLWMIAAGGCLGALLLVLVVSRGWVSKLLAVLAAVLALSVGLLGVNLEGGLFPSVASLVGGKYPDLVIPAGQPGAADGPTRAGERESDRLRGTVGKVVVPGRESGFSPRSAIVYLPPAARRADPPRLPVIVVLSGQGLGASPENVFDAGDLAATLDAHAAKHGGVAPIAIVPDQLGSALQNPMCVDGPLGNSATYLVRDVPHWVRTTFRVSGDRRDWGIAGFSQGGTCAVQIGAGHPELFGGFIAVGAQAGPTLGNERETIMRGFRGDQESWRAAQPEAIMRARAPYAETFAFLAAGRDDARYRPIVDVHAKAARASGITVATRILDGAHDWPTATEGIREGVAWWMTRAGIVDRLASGDQER